MLDKEISLNTSQLRDIIASYLGDINLSYRKSILREGRVKMSELGSHKDLEVVYITNDPVKVLLAKTLLESAGITYFVKGEHTANIFGWSSLSSFQPIHSEVEILVPEEEVEDCRDILRELDR